MSEIRNKSKINFTIVDNSFINANHLSLKARMLGIYIASKPPSWVVHVSQFAKEFKEGKAAIYSGMKELENYGYLRRVQVRTENGRFKNFNYEFSQIPYDFDPVLECDIEVCINSTDSAEMVGIKTEAALAKYKGIPHTDFPHTDFPHTENQQLINTDLNNTDINNKKINKKETVASAPVRVFDDFFYKLYDDYPKVGRKAIKKAYAALSKIDLSKHTPENISLSLEAQKKEKELYAKYNVFCPRFPDITTWINGNRWTDSVLDEREIKKIAKEQAKAGGKIFNDMDELCKRPSRNEVNSYAGNRL